MTSSINKSVDIKFSVHDHHGVCQNRKIGKPNNSKFWGKKAKGLKQDLLNENILLEAVVVGSLQGKFPTLYTKSSFSAKKIKILDHSPSIVPPFTYNIYCLYTFSRHQYSSRSDVCLTLNNNLSIKIKYF